MTKNWLLQLSVAMGSWFGSFDVVFALELEFFGDFSRIAVVSLSWADVARNEAEKYTTQDAWKLQNHQQRHQQPRTQRMTEKSQEETLNTPCIVLAASNCIVCCNCTYKSLKWNSRTWTLNTTHHTAQRHLSLTSSLQIDSFQTTDIIHHKTYQTAWQSPTRWRRIRLPYFLILIPSTPTKFIQSWVIELSFNSWVKIRQFSSGEIYFLLQPTTISKFSNISPDFSLSIWIQISYTMCLRRSLSIEQLRQSSLDRSHMSLVTTLLTDVRFSLHC